MTDLVPWLCNYGAKIKEMSSQMQSQRVRLVKALTTKNLKMFALPKKVYFVDDSKQF